VATTWSFVIALSLFGFVLLMLELFIIPGFGVAGIAGIIAIFAAVVYASMTLGIWVGIAIFAIGLIITTFGVIRLTSSSGFTKLRNKRVSPGKVVSDNEPTVRHLPKLGTEGVAITPLRPSGIVRFGDQRWDVVADGPIVESGDAVEVTELIGNVIKVRAI